MSLDGGNKGEEHAKQIVQDVKRIFQALEMKKLDDLFIKNNFRNQFLKVTVYKKIIEHKQ